MRNQRISKETLELILIILCGRYRLGLFVALNLGREIEEVPMAIYD